MHLQARARQGLRAAILSIRGNFEDVDRGDQNPQTDRKSPEHTYTGSAAILLIPASAATL